MKSTNNFQTSNPEMVTISRAEYEEKNARLASQDERIARLESQVELLTEALRLARHKRFGASSEKTDECFMEQLSFLFNEAEVVLHRRKRGTGSDRCGKPQAAQEAHLHTGYHSGRNPHEAGGASSGG